MNINQIQSEARDIFLNQDSSDAIKLIKVIKSEPILNNAMQLLFTQLQFIRMFSLSTDQLLTLLQKDLLVVYTIPDFYLSEKIESYIEQVESIAEQINVAKKIRITIQDNEAVFSEKNIVIKGLEQPGTIKNWITDFNSYPAKGGTSKGALDEIDYVNKSLGAKNISEVQKGVLRDILNLYDYLGNLIANWDAIPVPKTEQEASADFDLYQFIPGLEDDLVDEAIPRNNSPLSLSSNRDVSSDVEASRVAKPVVVTNPGPTSIPSASQSASKPRPSLEGISLTPREPGKYKNNSSSTVESPMSSADSAKIRDLINHKSASQIPDKRGVTKDPTNIKIDEEEQRLAQARAQQAAAIQNKLAELRKRNSKQ